MENKERLISASNLVISLAKKNHSGVLHYDDVMAVIADVPEVKAKPVVYANWEICITPNTFDTYGRPDQYARCSHCGFQWNDLYSVRNYFKHCINCGARMVGGADNA